MPVPYPLRCKRAPGDGVARERVHVYRRPPRLSNTGKAGGGNRDGKGEGDNVAGEVLSYRDVVENHDNFMRRRAEGNSVTPRPHLVLALESDGWALADAVEAGACAIGVGENAIEVDRLADRGAMRSYRSLDDLLRSFGVKRYHQLQYVPYTVAVRDMLRRKAGFPVSLLDCLHGTFTPSGGVRVERSAPRLVAKEVLGIHPGSLADDYLNNVGWTMDSSRSWRINTRDFERDVIRMFERYFELPPDQMRGFVTNGGTEGNFSGLWWQRDYLRGRAKNLQNSSKSKKAENCDLFPSMIMSDQTHYSSGKAAQQLGLECHVARTNDEGAIDLEDFARIVAQLRDDRPNKPMLVHVTAGTTQTGAIDDLVGVQQMLQRELDGIGVPYSVHLDAALIGGMLPIIKPWGDRCLFENLGVRTLAISGHKFFGSTAICGVALTTKQFLEECFGENAQTVGYVGGIHDITPSGSRSGFAVLSFHNTLCELGMHTDGARMKSVAGQCLANRNSLIRALSDVVGSEQVLCPKNSLNVCFPRPDEDIMLKYYLMPVTFRWSGVNGQLAGACALLNMNERIITTFIADYREWYKTCKGHT